MKKALKKCRIRPEDLEDVAANRNIWQNLCRDGVHTLEMERTSIRQQKRAKRNTAMAATTATTTIITYICPTCNRVCGSRIGLFSHQKLIIVDNLAGRCESAGPQIDKYPRFGSFKENYMELMKSMVKGGWGDPQWDYKYMGESYEIWKLIKTIWSVLIKQTKY